MKKLNYPTIVCLLVFLLLAVAAPVQADHTKQLLVQLEPDAASGYLDAIAKGEPRQLGGNVGLSFPVIRAIGSTIVVVGLAKSIPIEAAQALAQRLIGDPDVVYAEADRPLHDHSFVPNDPRFFQQWSLSEDLSAEPASNNAQGAWGEGVRGSQDIVIAVLDSGILPHEDIDANRLLPGFDFIADPVAANDGNGRDADATDAGDGALANECGPGNPEEDEDHSWHGLQTSGIIVASADNALGITGMDHFAKLLPVRVLGKCGGLTSDILDAMRWSAGLSVSGVPANANPAQVLNLSFGGEGSCSFFEQQIINDVVDRGVVVVASAGNSGEQVESPANCNNVLAVAAVGRDGERAGYTNTGSSVSISAPGGTGFDGILTTQNLGTSAPGTDSYALLQGTSITSPQVAAAAALVLSVNPSLSVSQVRTALESSARPFPDTSCNTAICGAGLLDVLGAVLTAAGLIPEPDEPVSTGGNEGGSSDSGGGGGGGGCSVGGQGTIDPVLLGILLIGWLGLLRRRVVNGLR